MAVRETPAVWYPSIVTGQVAKVNRSERPGKVNRSEESEAEREINIGTFEKKNKNIASISLYQQVIKKHPLPQNNWSYKPVKTYHPTTRLSTQDYQPKQV